MARHATQLNNANREDAVLVETLVRFVYREGAWEANLMSEPPRDGSRYFKLLIPVPEELQVPVIRSVVVDVQRT